MDKGAVGLIGGGGLAAIVAATAGFGTFGVAAAAVGGAYLGHELLDSHKYAPKYSYK